MVTEKRSRSHMEAPGGLGQGQGAWMPARHIFIRSSVDGRLSYFHVLAIVNSATMNTECVYLLELWVSPGIYAFYQQASFELQLREKKVLS